MRRVCIIRHNYYPDEPRVRRDAETLVHHGYQVDIVCLRRKGQKGRQVVNGVSVYRQPVEHHRRGILRYVSEYAAFFLTSWWTVSWLSLRRRYRVVEVVSMPELLVFAAVIPRLLGAEIVLHNFDATPETYAAKFNVGLDHIVVRLLRVVSKVCLALASHVIACEYTAEEIIRGRGVPGHKISVVFNVPDENALADQWGSPKQKSRFRIMTHGTILERYGVQTLIRAVPLLLKDIPELLVTVVGDGEYRPALEELARSLGVSGHVEFTGWVPFEEIPRLITHADIGIVPAIASMLPNKLFEYLALNRPVVAAATPAILACFDGSSLMLYEADNERDLARCVLELYVDPERRAALANAGHTVYQKYRWSTMKYEYLRVFDRLADRKSTLRKAPNRDEEGQRASKGCRLS